MRRTKPLGWLVCLALLAMTALHAPATAQTARGGWLGVSTQDLSSGLREGLDYEGDGVLVTRVVDGSPAERAGVRNGDILFSFNSRTLTSPEQLRTLVADSAPGRTVALGIVRDGRRRTLSAELTAREDESGAWEAPTPPTAPMTPRGSRTPRTPRAPREPEIHIWKDGKELDPDQLHDGFEMGDGDRKRIVIRTPSGVGAGRGRLGVRVESLNPDLAQALGDGSGRGVLVLEVMDGTAAQKAGIKAGDIIVSVDREAVSNTDELVSALKNEDGRVSIGVVRRGVKRTIEANLEDAPRMMRFNNGDGQLGLGRLREMERPRVRVEQDMDREELRKELERLRSELRDLKRELEDSKR
ncbi:MAG: PDZ domain-containing protein [Candidatus Eisenbacteria bacterium]